MQLKNNIFIRFTAIVSAAVMISACSGGGAAPAGAMGGGKQGGGPRQQKAAAISVNLTSPERETLERKTDFAARIEASQTVKVFPETGGTVSKVYFNVGGTNQNKDGFSQPAYFAYDDVAVQFTE